MKPSATYNQCISLFHPVIFLETYLTYKTLHTGIDGSNMLTDGGIVGIFHIAEMEKAVTNDEDTCKKHCKDDDVVCYSLSCSFHNLSLF